MNTDHPGLQDALANLTEIQRQAVDWNDGAFLLLAGPGSGKTRVLTARIARLLAESSTNRWRILALTFTNAAADEMRDRIQLLVPGTEERLFIGTFHSFACEILRQSGSLTGVRTDFKIYSMNADRLELLNRALASITADKLPAEKVLPVLDRLRERLVPPQECERFFSNEETGKVISAAYTAYDKILTEENVLDFPSLIYRAYWLFKNYPAIAQKFSSAYKYLCIDEFQDTNSSQYDLIRVFTRDVYANVFAVADDDQIIYQWNGASHKRLEQFQKDYSPQSLQMPTNFRCPSSVVTLANNLVAHNRLRFPGKRPLEVGNLAVANSDEVRIFNFPTDRDEAIGIANDIAATQANNIENVCLVARTKALLELAKEALRDVGITAQIAQRRDDFASLPYIWLQAALNLANRRADARLFELFAEASNKLLGLDVDVPGIPAVAASTHGDLLRAWCAETAKLSVAHGFSQELFELVSSTLAARNDHRKFVRSVVGIFSRDRAQLETEYPSLEEDARAWRGLFKEITATIGANAALESFLQELDMRSKEPPVSAGVLQLLTIHGSKGKEFDHVYLIGLAEDILPSYQSRSKGDDSSELEEERRNCFVAITRCMKTLTLSYASKYRNWNKAPSRFLREMGISPSSNS